MIKKTAGTIILSFFTCLLFSQDTIYKTDGSRILCKVKEIDTKNVSYSVGNENLKSDITDIAYISYSKGQREEFNMNYLRTENKKEFHKNIIAVNVFDMAFINFSCSYERIMNSGKLGLKIPFSAGMGGKPRDTEYSPDNYDNTTYLYNKIFGSGLEINFYPAGQTRHTFYIGVSGIVGSFNYYQYTHDTITNNYSGGYPYYTYPVKEKINRTGMHYAGMLHIGGYLGLSENILLGGKFGVGYKREETVYVDYTHPKLQLDLNLAFKF